MSNLTVVITGTGSGTVVCATPVISCPGTCGPVYIPTVGFGPFNVLITATPNFGSVFYGWSVNPTGPGFMNPSTSGSPTETFTFNNVDTDYIITARFDTRGCSPITITNNPIPNCVVGTPYGPVQLIATGGTAPYTFTLVPGLDPPCDSPNCNNDVIAPGLNLSSTGIITGTPSTPSACPGNFSPFKVRVMDANQCFTDICIDLTIDLPPTCYELISCDLNKHANVLVNDNLSGYVGQLVQIDGFCFTVQIAQGCLGSITMFPNGVPQLPTFVDCCHCNPPHCYELRDCTLQNPVIDTNTDLSKYIGKTLKLCNFDADYFLTINLANPITCSPGDTLGFITQITGPTSGFYYENGTGLIKAYSNLFAYPLAIGSAACFGPTGIMSGMGTHPTNYLEFFLGTVSVTNSIPISTSMTQSFLQYLINLNITDPSVTITIVTFDFAGLHVQIHSSAPTDATDTTVTITPDFQGQGSVTSPLSGACICYTVVDIGPCCGGVPLDTPISGVFDDCDCCLPAPEKPQEPPFKQSVPEIAKGYYRIPESQCDIDANTTFASAMYTVFKEKQYGISGCCIQDINKAWIEKELSDLNFIKHNPYVCP